MIRRGEPSNQSSVITERPMKTNCPHASHSLHRTLFAAALAVIVIAAI
jgi:hypothetical protein